MVKNYKGDDGRFFDYGQIKNMKILIIGHFYSNGIHGAGQHIRTSTVSDSIEYYCPQDQIVRFDLTQGHILPFAKFIFCLKTADVIILFPGKNALGFIKKLIREKYNSKAILVAIGGWLSDFIKENNYAFFAGLAGIFVQTPEMVSQLKQIGLNNVTLFPNYRIMREKNISVRYASDNEMLKMVFCSRVVKEKGVFEIVEASRKLCDAGLDQFVIDFYGPGSKEDIAELENASADLTQVHIKGYIDNSIMIETLSNYDMMLFPTYYAGEGFPGVIIESFIAGVPVIASKWRYNEQYIVENETGLLCDIKSSDSIFQAMVKIYKDRSLVNKMKDNCSEISLRYREEEVMKPLLKSIDNLRVQSNLFIK